MRWRDPRWLLALVSLGLVLWLFTLDSTRTSPGPLSAAHAGSSELAGSDGCDRCHGDFGSRLEDSCADCHAAVAAQMADGSGLHGALAARGEAAGCERCHPEHHGPELDLVGEAAFAHAGFGAREGFAHAYTEFALVGAHARLDCARCHTHADSVLPPAGELRFGGLAQDCASCHADPHAGRFGAGCADCHGQELPFDALDGFVHERGLALRGAHLGLACVACHPAQGERSVAALASGAATPAPRACLDCHESPHANVFVADAAARARVAPAAACGVCHQAEHGRFDADAAAMPRALHGLTGFELEGPHGMLDCAACHADGYARDSTLPARRADDCAACHVDPHAGQFAARACLDCHARERFTPVHFDASDHAAAGFALTGAHAAVDCAACHAPGAEPDAPRTFRGTPTDCAACHANVHPSQLAAAIAAPAADCAACHLPTRFAEVDAAAFDHGRWTEFALLGAHARADCEACHQSAAPERRLGRVAQRFPGPLETCATCHADSHRGAFGDDDCAACHSAHGFADPELRATFAHGLRTGFELAGAHAALDCAGCHGAGSAAASVADGRLAHARAFGFASEHARGDPATCAGCHDDPHGGLFAERAALDERDARASCAACHSADAFQGTAQATFDHGRWAAFVLDGAHALLDCAACHAASEPHMPGMRELGVAAGRGCAACHADPHAGQFASAGRNDCARCHDTAAGFAARGFDHARDSRFALDERHAELACSACHVPWPVPGLGEVVRYKPLGTQCIDCHDHGGKGGGG
jgi:hypothetical protein